jgi:hypothetical protein
VAREEFEMKVVVVGKSKIIPMREVKASFYDPERDGVTFSLLTTFKGCREKARLFLMGWTSKKSSLGLVFGSLTHGIQQKMYEDVRDGRLREVPSEDYIKKLCRRVEKQWKEENPRADGESVQYLEHSMILLEALMPLYFRYWKKDFQLLWDRVEAVFKVPIEIDHPQRPGRVLKTFVRGKMDGSFRRSAKGRPVLFETKTKAYLNEQGEADLADILPHELQANIYLLHLWALEKVLPEGLLYNIIRRPGLRQKKKENIVKFAKRVADDVRKRPEFYFVRMQMSVTRKDLERNEMEMRDLVADFLMWWNGLAGHYKNSDHCQNKYGRCANLGICSRGDYSGFYKRETVFRELADEL